MIIINTVNEDQRRLNQAFSLTCGAATVSVVKRKWIILHLEHGKGGWFWGQREREIVKERRRGDKVVEQQHKGGDALLVSGSGLQPSFAE